MRTSIPLLSLLTLLTACSHAGPDAAGGAAAVNNPATPPDGPPHETGVLPPEPKIPPACTTLVATKTAVDGLLPAADETAPDTDKLQAALDGCAHGQSVRLKGDGKTNAFLTGPIKMPSGVTLWIDAGTTLFASRNPRDYDVGAGRCGTDAYDESNGCKPLILVEKAADVGLMGDGTIDGRGGEPMLGVAGNVTWWDVAQHAKTGDKKHSNPRLVDVKKAKSFVLYKLRLYNSPKFHVVINSAGYTVWGVKVLTPSRKTNSVGRALTPFYARNTDGIDPSAASDGVIAFCDISTGDDQIAVKAGDQGEIKNLMIAHNRFGSGHGMSIGSETNGGVNGVMVHDLVIDGAVDHGGMPNSDRNGIRIKSDLSRGGLVQDVTYSHVCMRNVVNPILISPHYSKADGHLIPDYQKIVLANVRSIAGTGPAASPVVRLEGADGQHPLDVTLDNVVVDGVSPGNVKAEYAEVKLGPGPVNFVPAGNDVSVSGAGSGAALDPCAGRFK
jgi:polygalacturonase